ncbi:MAG TPA: glycosyltransferase [Burkholderiaceae bacterium]|nr:glycosyltransferase [Burkholderiaceae bacterium]
MTGELLLVSHGFQPHYELCVANGLADNGLRVTLPGSDRTLVGMLREGVRFVNLRGSQDERRPRWKKAYGLIRYHLRLSMLALRHPRRPIVVIGMTSPEWLVGVGQGLLFRATGRKLALMVHNILPHDRHTPQMRRVYRLIYRIPSRLLVHTQATREGLISEFGVPPEKILLVPHGLNEAVSRRAGDVVAAKRHLGLDPQRPAVLFFGHISPFKGIDVLLDALDEMPHVQLIVAGKCHTDEFGRRMHRRLQELAASGRIRWFDGYVDDETTADVYSAAELVVLPYRHIDQSGVLMQALALGVPVATTRTGGFMEVVNPLNGVFIDELSPRGIARTVSAYFERSDRPSVEQVRATVGHLRWRCTVSPLVEWLSGRDPTQEPEGSADMGASWLGDAR